MSIDLAPHLLERVRAILHAHVSDCEVWAFGSRVDANSKPFSDLDLAVISATELPVRRLALLTYAFEESDLPIKVDVIDWQSASPAFRQRIAESRDDAQRISTSRSPRSSATRTSGSAARNQSSSARRRVLPTRTQTTAGPSFSRIRRAAKSSSFVRITAPTASAWRHTAPSSADSSP